MICRSCRRWSARGSAFTTANGVPRNPWPFPKLVFELVLEPGERLGVPVDELGWTGIVRHVSERILGGRVRDAKPDDNRDKRDESHESTSGYVESARASIRVVEAGEDLRLPLEPGEAIRISREGVGEDLQRDLAVELGVGGLPDLAHAALAQEGRDVVLAERGARLERHESLRISRLYLWPPLCGEALEADRNLKVWSAGRPQGECGVSDAATPPSPSPATRPSTTYPFPLGTPNYSPTARLRATIPPASEAVRSTRAAAASSCRFGSSTGCPPEPRDEFACRDVSLSSPAVAKRIDERQELVELRIP